MRQQNIPRKVTLPSLRYMTEGCNDLPSGSYDHGTGETGWPIVIPHPSQTSAKTMLDEQRKQIESMLKTENQMLFVAESDHQLVGHLQAFGGRLRRNRKTLYLVVGVLQVHAGRGVGTALFQTLEEWARNIGVHRLELTVMTHNAAAVALYRKMGFEVEGTARDTLLVDGRYVDEYLMAKLL